MINTFQVQADGGRPFTAGFCTDAKGDVWAAAPIIRWMEGKPFTFIRQYCMRKKWRLTQVS